LFLSSCGGKDDSVSDAPPDAKPVKKDEDLERLVFAPSKLSFQEALLKYGKEANRSSQPTSKMLTDAATRAAAQGDNDSAEMLLDEAIKLDDKNAEAYFRRGRVRCNAIAGKDQAAIDDLNRSIALGRPGPEAHLSLARLYDANKQPRMAIDSLTAAIKLSPKTKELYKSRAAIYVSIGEKEKALNDYAQLAKLDPDSMAAFFQQGQVLESMKRFDDACVEYKKLLLLDETKQKVPLKAIAYKRLAVLYGNKGKHKEAIDFLTEAAKFDVEDDEPLRLRGLEYLKIQNYKQAVADLTEAIEISPDTGANFAARAEAYSKLGKTELAEKDRLEAKRLNDAPAERPMFELKDP
jgi:tetratricopeptide (TPR) repeat protein